MNKKQWKWILLAALACVLGFVVTSCTDDDDKPEPEPAEVKKGAPYEVMVAFAPGQLGDQGYADNVLEGVNLLSRFTEVVQDTLYAQFNVRFISPYDMDDLRESLEVWAGNTANPFVDDSYQRRLLVLTEPYMVNYLDSVNTLLRPSDEILVMKVNGDDVQQAANRYGLGSRIHGLNISAAPSIRRFCKMMKTMTRQAAENGTNTNYGNLPFYRLFDEKTMVYRDSIQETLVEELGSDATILSFVLSSEEDQGIVVTESAYTVYQMAYVWADAWQKFYEFSGFAFAIVDLGSGNAGWDYWLMGRKKYDDTYYTLIIDGEESPLLYRYYVQRHFDYALMNWVSTWVSKPAASMPPFMSYDKMKYENVEFSEYCEDNIPHYD